MGAGIHTGSSRNSHKVEPSGVINSRELITKQPPHHNHGRDSGRKHSSTSNNYFRTLRTTVARKSTRRESYPGGYTLGPLPPQGSQLKVVEQRREPSQFGQSGSGGSPAKVPSLDRRSVREADSRNRGTDIKRLGVVDSESGRVGVQTRWARDNNYSAEER